MNEIYDISTTISYQGLSDTKKEISTGNPDKYFSQYENNQYWKKTGEGLRGDSTTQIYEAIPPQNSLAARNGFNHTVEIKVEPHKEGIFSSKYRAMKNFLNRKILKTN